jgi:hypothetical protein
MHPLLVTTFFIQSVLAKAKDIPASPYLFLRSPNNFSFYKVGRCNVSPSGYHIPSVCFANFSFLVSLCFTLTRYVVPSLSPYFKHKVSSSLILYCQWSHNVDGVGKTSDYERVECMGTTKDIGL